MSTKQLEYLVFTPVHGIHEMFERSLCSVDQVVPGRFLHYLVDDFSPGTESQTLLNYARGEILRQSGDVTGERRIVHARSLGATEPPNLGLMWGWVFHEFRRRRLLGQDSLRGVLSVESDVVLRPGIVEAFEAAVDEWDTLFPGKLKCGMVVPLYTDVDCDTITSWGGMGPNDGAEYLHLCVGQRIGGWQAPEVARMDGVAWAHLAAAWIPASTLLRSDIVPDPAFRLYHFDHDFSHTLHAARLEVVLTSNAVAEHSRREYSTGRLWPDHSELQRQHDESWSQVSRKWG